MAVFDNLNPLKYVTPRFTEEQLEDIVKWFDENSQPLLMLVINETRVPTNVITIEQLQTFLGLKTLHRRSFKTPSYYEIMRQVEALKMERQRMLTKDQFIYMLDKWVMEPDMNHELKMAFKVFDTEERGFLETDILREILVTYGEHPLDEDEVTEFLRDADVRGDGNIIYAEFVDSLFKLAPELAKLEKEYLYEDPDNDPSTQTACLVQFESLITRSELVPTELVVRQCTQPSVFIENLGTAEVEYE
ncbi:EF-hand domain pair domain-containing protein [Phthorimaea operculella]|nr:EF-hand domain pair domain-containing protein [Phthorimaea operculella]